MAVLKAEFTVNNDCIEFRTQTNGDIIRIKQTHLGPTEAANLAQLINSGKILTVIVKEKVE